MFYPSIFLYLNAIKPEFSRSKFQLFSVLLELLTISPSQLLKRSINIYYTIYWNETLFLSVKLPLTTNLIGLRESQTQVQAHRLFLACKE